MWPFRGKKRPKPVETATLWHESDKRAYLEKVLANADAPSIEDRLDDIIEILLHKGSIHDEELESRLKCRKVR